MTKRRTWLAALLFLLLVFAGGLAWLFTADLGRFQPQLSSVLGNWLGREVAFDQALSIRLGRELQVRVRGLRVDNADWASQPDLLRVERLDVSIRLSSLWWGPLVITSLEASGLRAWPERSATGLSNLPAPVGGGEPATPARGLPLFQHVALQDLRVELLDPTRVAPLIITVDTLQQEQRDDGMLAVQASGAIDGSEAKFQGTLGTIDALLQGRDLHFQGAGQFGVLRFDGEGRIDDLSAPRHPELRLDLSGDDFEPVARVFNRPAPDSGPFNIRLTTGQADGSWRLQAEGSIGALTVSAAGTSAGIAEFRSADFRVNASGPDLGAFTAFVGLGAWPREAFRLTGSIRREGELFRIDGVRLDVGETQLALDATLPAFPAWRGGEGRLDITGKDVAAFRALVGFEGEAQGDFEVRLALLPGEDGGDRLQGSLRTGLLQMTLDSAIGDGPHGQGSQLHLTMAGPDAGVLLRGYGMPGFADQAFTLGAQLEVLDRALLLQPGTVLVLGDDHLELTGTLALPPFSGGTELEFKVRGDDLSQFAPLLKGPTVLPGQPYALAGGLQLATGAVQLDRVRGTVGPNELELAGRVPLGDGLAGTELQLAARGPHLDTLVADTPGFDVPDGDFDLSGRLRYQAEALEVDRLEARVGALEARARISLSLPLNQSSGRFDVQLAGPDPGHLWPESLAFQPGVQPFALTLIGTARAGVWTFEQAALSLGEARFSMSGSMDQLPDFSAAQLKLVGQAPDIARLGTIGGHSLPGGLLDISANFTGSRHRFQVEDLVLQVGESDLKGRLSADFESAVPVLEWHSRSRMLDLVGRRGVIKAQQAAGPQAGGLPFPDLAFPMERLARFDARMNLAADELRLDQRHFTNVLLAAELRNGALRVSRLRGEGRRGFVDGTMSLSPRPDGAADLALAFTAEGLVVHLSRDSVVDPETQPVVEYEVSLTGHGHGLHEAAATLDGYAQATASAGIIPNSVLSMLEVGLIEQVLTTVLPVSASETTTTLECVALRLEAKRGLLRTAPVIALVTDRVQMVSSGTVNLANGRLDLTFENYPNKAYKTNVSELLVNPFVKISGTLAQPEIVLDAPKALVYSGIAIGTGGLSIIAKGLYDRVRHSSNPCEKFIEQARKGK